MKRTVRIAWVVVVAVILGACGDDDDPPPPPSAQTRTQTPVEPATTTTTLPLRESIARILSPEAASIATALGTLSGKTVTVAAVTSLATSVCTSSFKAAPAITYLRTTLAVRPISTLPVSDRLLALASTDQVCTRRPTTAETQAYQRDFFTYALSVGTSATTATTLFLGGSFTFPTPFTTQVCSLFDDAKGFVDKGLSALLKFASNERIEGGFLLTLAVEVASAKCPQWFPNAQSIYRQFIGG